MTTTPALDRGEDLSRFRYHTGATLRRLAPDEPCRLLFRDVGPWAMARFLRGELKRLAGPYAPILYTRTADYREPFTDHEPVGRIIFLQPKRLRPWYSGVPTIFVASVRQRVEPTIVGFVPPHLTLTDAERTLQGVTDAAALRESFGGKCYEDAVRETLAGLDRLNAEHAEVECRAEPLRRKLQSGRTAESEWAREWLAGHGLSETDLCTAWHHLPRERRERFRACVQGLRRAGSVSDQEVRPC
jgi:hypothetical protein